MTVTFTTLKINITQNKCPTPPCTHPPPNSNTSNKNKNKNVTQIYPYPYAATENKTNKKIANIMIMSNKNIVKIGKLKIEVVIENKCINVKVIILLFLIWN